MSYIVKFLKSNTFNEDSKTDSLEQAVATAKACADWNYAVDVIVLETGEVVRHFDAYNADFAR